MMLSDNVTPINAFRVNRVAPLQLPSILKFLGPMRMEFFVGHLEGQHFVVAPSGVVSPFPCAERGGSLPMICEFRFAI